MDKAQASKKWPKHKDATPPKTNVKGFKAPKTMSPPRHLHDASHVKVDSSPSDLDCLMPSASMRERGRRTPFSPSAPVAMDIADLVYQEIVTAHPEVLDILLPEYLRYYTTAGIWMRIVALKSQNQQPMTQMERILLENIKSRSYICPQPLLMQYKQLGNVLTLCGQHLFPLFPPMPSANLLPYGGFYGPLQALGTPGADDNLHNLYEELPCLGVAAKAVQKAVSDEVPGHYDTVVTFEGRQPNHNLLGFQPLGVRTEASKMLAFDADITDDEFPCYPPSSGMSIPFLQSISDVLANFPTFKNTDINFSTLNEVGSSSQITVERPTPTANKLTINGSVEVKSMARVSDTVIGTAACYLPQLYKESRGTHHEAWCLISPENGHPVPIAWVRNRNLRRNDLPEQYRHDRFSSAARESSDYRINIVKTLVLH